MPVFDFLLADSPELREAAYRFRYEIYVEQMGRRQTHADHGRRMVEEPLDDTGRVYIARREGVVVGTIRGNAASDKEAAYYRKLYRLEKFGFRDLSRIQLTTKLMIHPHYSGTIVGPRLISAYAADGYRSGVQVDFIDCNKHLIPFFERLGYFSYCGWVFHKEYGTVRPMFLPVDTISNLRQKKSFLAPLASCVTDDGAYGGYDLIRLHAENAAGSSGDAARRVMPEGVPA